jgi:hypothetical protein
VQLQAFSSKVDKVPSPILAANSNRIPAWETSTV